MALRPSMHRGLFLSLALATVGCDPADPNEPDRDAGQPPEDAAPPADGAALGGRLEDCVELETEAVVAPFTPANYSPIEHMALDGPQLFFANQHYLFRAGAAGAPEELLHHPYRAELLLHAGQLLTQLDGGQFGKLVPRGGFSPLTDLPQEQTQRWLGVENGVAYAKSTARDPNRSGSKLLALNLETGETWSVNYAVATLGTAVLVGDNLYLAELAPDAPPRSELCVDPACTEPRLAHNVVRRAPTAVAPTDVLEVKFADAADYGLLPLGGDSHGLLLAAFALEGSSRDPRQGLYRVPLEGGEALQLVQTNALDAPALRASYARHGDKHYVYVPGVDELYEITSRETPAVRRLCTPEGTITSLAANAQGVYLGMADAEHETISVRKLALEAGDDEEATIRAGSCLLRSDLEAIEVPVVVGFTDRLETGIISRVAAHDGDAYYLRDLTQLTVRRDDGTKEHLWSGGYSETWGEGPDTEFAVLEDGVLVAEDSSLGPDQGVGLFLLPNDGSPRQQLNEDAWSLATALLHEGKLYYSTPDFVVVDLATGTASSLTGTPLQRYYGPTRASRPKPAVAGEWLYRGANGRSPSAALERVPLAGGAVERLEIALDPDDTGTIEVLGPESDESLVIASVASPTRVYRVPYAGGDAVLLGQLESPAAYRELTFVRLEGESLIHLYGADTVYTLKDGDDALEPLFCLSSTSSLRFTTDRQFVYLQSKWWVGRLPLDAVR